MTDTFPRPDEEMMAARVAAFASPPRPIQFDLEAFLRQDVRPTRAECDGLPTPFIDDIVSRLATPPDGAGAGYCLVTGLSEWMSVESVRSFSALLFDAVWTRYRARCARINSARDFYFVETLTNDGEVDADAYGSAWTFKPPHSDRNGLVFAHVYGPHCGFTGGDVLVVDALAFALGHGMDFSGTMKWSDDAGPQKPVLQPDHVASAVARYGRTFGPLSPDAILLVNNGPEGLLHGATELVIANWTEFSRPIHRIVVRERDSDE